MDNRPPPHKTWTSSPGVLIETAPAYSAHQFMVLGLKIAKILNWQRRKEKTNIDAFRRKYSGTPQTVEDIYNKMRLSADLRIRLRANAKPMHLLLALRFIRKYEAEEDLGNFFGILSRTTVEKYLNEYMPRIHLLMVNRLVPLEQVHDDLIMFLSVDGVQAPTNEQRPFSAKSSSFKFGGKPGVNYEFGILIHREKLAWINGPTWPGEMNDVMVFQRKLKGALPPGTLVHGVAICLL